MKHLTTNLTLAAIALAVTAGVASAQQFKAEIPFSFSTQGWTVAAGTYTVAISNTIGKPLFLLRNAASGKAMLLANGIPGDPSEAWLASGDPKLQFECGEDGCALRRIWTNTGESAYTFSRPKRQNGESSHLTVIRLAATKSK